MTFMIVNLCKLGWDSNQLKPSNTWTYFSLPVCKTDEGVRCIFPYIYKGVIYNECTDIDADGHWCSTGNYANGTCIEEDRAYCGEDCSYEL